MQTNFSKEEIKNSVECKWRKYQIKSLFIIYLFIIVICFFVIAFCTFEKNYSFHNLKVLITSWLIVIISIGLGLLPMFLYNCFKLCYVLNHYQEFLCYEVLLEHFSTSFSYRHSVYYTVTISCDGVTKKIDTNSYFSNCIFSIFSPEEFNHQLVIGLYDERLEKFYIIKKIN